MLPGEIPPSRLKSSSLELDHVFRVYDSIAVHWNHTRGRRKVHWHRVKNFLENLHPGSLVAGQPSFSLHEEIAIIAFDGTDIGSGDGKYFSVNPNITVIGCDRSLKLLEV